MLNSVSISKSAMKVLAHLCPAVLMGNIICFVALMMSED